MESISQLLSRIYNDLRTFDRDIAWQWFNVLKANPTLLIGIPLLAILILFMLVRVTGCAFTGDREILILTQVDKRLQRIPDWMQVYPVSFTLDDSYTITEIQVETLEVGEYGSTDLMWHLEGRSEESRINVVYGRGIEGLENQAINEDPVRLEPGVTYVFSIDTAEGFEGSTQFTTEAIAEDDPRREAWRQERERRRAERRARQQRERERQERERQERERQQQERQQREPQQNN